MTEEILGSLTLEEGKKGTGRLFITGTLKDSHGVHYLWMWFFGDGKEYLVYYFGHCYLEDHMEQLSSMATEAPQPQS